MGKAIDKWIILTHRLTTYGASSSSRSRWTLPATTNGVNGKQTHDATAFDNSSVFPLFGEFLALAHWISASESKYPRLNGSKYVGLSEVGYNKRGFGSFWVRFSGYITLNLFSN